MNDGSGATATATVNITVNPVNDAPVAGADSATVSEGGSVPVNVLANDSDVDDTLTAASIELQPRHGTVANNADGTFTYTQTAETTADSFTYTINDGSGATATATVNITVTPVNDAPVAGADAVTVAEGAR